jgi:CRP-like cAMP-binding protein
LAVSQRSEIRNRMLLALPLHQRDELIRECARIEFPHRHVIYPRDAPIDNYYFIDRGFVSLIRTMHDGRSAEVGHIGVEGVAGLLATYGSSEAAADYVVQVPVTALRISRTIFQNALARNQQFRRIVDGYLLALAGQLAQVAACNRLHSLEQRFCYWLLLAHDNAFSDTFSLVHEFLALMLGAQRPSVSTIASKFQQRGIIRYVHGRVSVLDRPEIERAACECYRETRAQVDGLFNSVHIQTSA